MKSENAVKSEVVIRAFQMGFALWRNNSGVLDDKNGTPVRFGLGNESPKVNKVWKSADFIGIGPYGRMLAVETKKEGWTKPTNDRERAQQAFLDDVNRYGGIGIFATSADDFERQVRAVMT